MGKVNKALVKKGPVLEKGPLIVKAKPKKAKKPKSELKTIKTTTSPKQKLIKKEVKKLKAPIPVPLVNNVKLDDKQVKSGIKALRELLEKQSKEKKKLFDEEAQPIFLQINLVKIPKCPWRIVHFPMAHSLFTDDSEICLITADIRENGKDHEKTVKDYEELLEKRGVTLKIDKIIPFKQLKQEHSQFESQKRLIQLYDFLLVDRRIEGYVRKFCGPQVKKLKKYLLHVSLDEKELDNHFRTELNKAHMAVHSKGNSYAVGIAHTKMTDEQIWENVRAALDGLEKVLPGGTENIKNLHVKAATSMGVPIYVSLKPNSQVRVPVVKSQRPKAHRVIKGELSTRNNSDIIVFPSGEVRVKPIGEAETPVVAKKRKAKGGKKKQVVKKQKEEIESIEKSEDEDENVEVHSQNGVKKAKKVQNGVEKKVKKKKKKKLVVKGEKKEDVVDKKIKVKTEAKKLKKMKKVLAKKSKPNVKKGKAK